MRIIDEAMALFDAVGDMTAASASAALAPAPDFPSHIRGLEDLWARHTFRSQAQPTRASGLRPMLDVLGLGLEQTLTYLGNERPDFAAFQAWILDMAGEPDPLKVARFHAWLDGAPPPDKVAHALRAIDEAPTVLDRTIWRIGRSMASSSCVRRSRRSKPRQPKSCCGDR